MVGTVPGDRDHRIAPGGGERRPTVTDGLPWRRIATRMNIFPHISRYVISRDVISSHIPRPLTSSLSLAPTSPSPRNVILMTSSLWSYSLLCDIISCDVIPLELRRHFPLPGMSFPLPSDIIPSPRTFPLPPPKLLN